MNRDSTVRVFSRGGVPAGLVSRAELAAEGLVPGGQPAVGRVGRSCGSQRGSLVALFVRAAALPARPSTLAELVDTTSACVGVVTALGDRRGACADRERCRGAQRGAA